MEKVIGESRRSGIRQGDSGKEVKAGGLRPGGKAAELLPSPIAAALRFYSTELKNRTIHNSRLEHDFFLFL